MFKITWKSSPNIDKVTIGYKDCSSCLSWIVNGIPNTGYYDWTAGVGYRSQVTIYIIGYQTGVGSVSDVSDAPFTVLPPPSPTPTPTLWIKVTSPNGGEVITEGDVFRITWASSPSIDRVSIGYKACYSCLDWIAFDTPNTGYYDWPVSVGYGTSQYTIEITGYQTGIGSAIDTSDAPFTVVKLPTATPANTSTPLFTSTPTIVPTFTMTPIENWPLSMTIISPSIGETLTYGETYRINWEAPPGVYYGMIAILSRCMGCTSDWDVEYNDLTPYTGYFDWDVIVDDPLNKEFAVYIEGRGSDSGFIVGWGYVGPFYVVYEGMPPVPTSTPTTAFTPPQMNAPTITPSPTITMTPTPTRDLLHLVVTNNADSGPGSLRQAIANSARQATLPKPWPIRTKGAKISKNFRIGSLLTFKKIRVPAPPRINPPYQPDPEVLKKVGKGSMVNASQFSKT